ncbi:uncharacterized protein EI90DRAFT_2923158, partial [Cantharellus anzutake]|uniref:uncharacterized protein n=1 Tax=Cantharellus anzutake TaxID=1750568 RepID=UPI001906DFD5
PDLYLHEIQQILERYHRISVCESTVWLSLKQWGFTHKKVCITHIYDYIPHLGTIWVCIIKLNSLFLLMRQDAITILPHAPMAGHHLVTELVVRIFSCKALSVYSILPALTIEGMLHVNIQQGAYTTATFNDFIWSLLPRCRRNNGHTMETHYGNMPDKSQKPHTTSRYENIEGPEF